MPQTLTLDIVKQAVAGTAAAFRRVVELQPAGGPGAKVFPPTHLADEDGNKYATEQRRIDGKVEECVLLDSVQSQANRMEMALQDAIEIGRIALPLIAVDFSNTPVAVYVDKITSLQAPHRIADAILRDSLLDGKEFRSESEIGVALDRANARNATVLFEHCPTALVFGMWDSTALHRKSDLGVKIPRAITSEIIGVGVVKGRRTSSRIDPLQIVSRDIYEARAGGWTADRAQAKLDEKGNPISFKDGRPSSINHSNQPPTIEDGGFTMERAQQITVLSLPALRRLKFPIDGVAKAETDSAARVVLASLALCAATLASEQGYDLRSNCLLVATSPFVWKLIDQPGKESPEFGLTGEQAVAIFRQAVEEAKAKGLLWRESELTLKPQERLVGLIMQSRTFNEAEGDGKATTRRGGKPRAEEDKGAE